LSEFDKTKENSVKKLFQTASGTHIIEATTSELATLFLSRQALDAMCADLEFIIPLTAAPVIAAPIPEPPLQQKAGFVKSDRPSVKSEQRTCAKCGKAFTPFRKDQKCCSTVCGRSYHAPKPVVKAVRAAKPKAEPASTDARVCKGCGKTFTPARKDQKCCNVACRKKYSNTHKDAKPLTARPPAPAIPSRPPQPAAPAVDRLAAIRAADAKARLKSAGITVPASAFGSDSGIGVPTADDIAAVRAGRDE
jgi:hypothetical protein